MVWPGVAILYSDIRFIDSISDNLGELDHDNLTDIIY